MGGWPRGACSSETTKLIKWRTTGIFQHHSGDALTAYTGTDNSSTGLLQDRAQREAVEFRRPVLQNNVVDIERRPEGNELHAPVRVSLLQREQSGDVVSPGDAVH